MGLVLVTFFLPIISFVPLLLNFDGVVHRKQGQHACNPLDSFHCTISQTCGSWLKLVTMK